MKQPVLHDISWVLGAPQDIGDLADVLGVEAIASLTGDGLRHYLVSDTATSEMAMEALAASIKAADVAPGEIDLILYSTTGAIDAQPKLADLCAGQGLARSPIVAIGAAGCANVAAAIRIACALISTEGLQHIAVVTADKAATPASRLTQFGATVLSDGAAAVLVSAERTEGWQILSSAQRADHKLRKMDEASQYPRLLVQTSRRIREATAEALAGAGIDGQAIGQVVMTNLKHSANLFVVTQAGLPAGRLYGGSLAGLAHVFSADPLINLANYSDAAPPGSFVAMLTLSPYNWSATVLRRCGSRATIAPPGGQLVN
jgi:3-Oxoacyl-[acyl-carrier-protein (ACP)] synthase III